ncbi:hypothetical protein [Roseisolibacter agri]|uniref:ABC-type transport auxiliary lipoprotein component domain-containing protein n=1 Tax=Roseisolibacter agri TaxID=2014610 RepID=A0AA37QGP4_9BACT|nr:hypothetical protein [Roseisolibacter agri]GLC26070.1 hypothetical protein rosag_25830 [Roseisolibacter agri]
MRRSVKPLTTRATPLLRALPLLAAAACASGGASTAAPPVEATRTVVTSTTPTIPDIELNRDTRLAVHRTTSTPDRVWAALPAALADVGLSGGPMAGQARTYIALMPSVRRQLNKVALSRYLDCGTTASGERGADTHLIRLQVTNIVEPDPQGARVRFQVLARATSTEGSGGTTDCATTGVLESRIGEALEARLRNP